LSQAIFNGLLNFNVLKKIILSYLLLLVAILPLSAQMSYNEMQFDNSINFYEVCNAAESYFANIDKEAKGSGWKPYQRWKNANKYKYYPSGDRSQTDPEFPLHAYEYFLTNNPQIKALFSNGWNELGPLIIDSLTGHYSAGFGRVEDIYVDPNNSSTVYLGSRSGGFWRSFDGGVTWDGSTTDFLFATGVNTFDVLPSNSNVILANVQNSNNAYSHGLYQSLDAGDTWVQTNFNPSNVGFGGLGSSFRVFKVAYHPTVPNLIFIGTSKGIYRSDDNLATWTRLIGTGDITAIDFHPTNSNIIYLLDTYSPNNDRDYVYKSTDQGLSYNLSNQIIDNNNNSGRLSTSPVCPNCLYFASNDGVWKSEDAGVNFFFLSNPGQSCGGFCVSDVDTSNMIYGYVDIERTINSGLDFEKVTWWSLGSTEHGTGSFNEKFVNSTQYVHADLRIAKSIGGVFYVGTDGMFAKSTDNGASWEGLSQGLGIRENYKLGASQSNHYKTISGSQDNGTSIKIKDDWIEFYGADGMEGLIHPLNDNWLIGSVQYGSRRRTLDGGLSQSGVNASGQNGSGSAAWEAPIAYDPNDHMRLYNFSDSVYVSDDFADNWTFRGVPGSFTGTINQAAIAENNSNIIVISRGSEIDKSTDAGATFSSIKNVLPNASIEDIAFDSSDDDVILICYANYNNDNAKIFMTTNGGNTWNNITLNLGDMPIHTIVVDHSPERNIYIGAEIGVYTKAMNSAVWTLYNQNLPNTTIEELEIVYGSNTLKAATWGRGLWEYSLVDRLEYPAIVRTFIDDMPDFSNPKIGLDQYVHSLISYEGVLSNVYVEWSANAPTFGNVILMSNTQDSTWVSDMPLPNLAVGTKLYFKVFAIGVNSDTSETYKFMYTVLPFEYCPTSGTMTYQGNVTLVDFNTISNATGKTQVYTDYTTTDSTEVYQGQSYDLTVNLNTDNGNYEYFARAWIDWNKDADFDDLGEVYDLGSVINNVDAPTDLSPFTINVPFGAQLGTTTMRVACRYDNYPELCENGFDGEVEDYALIVIPTANLSYILDLNNVCEGEAINFTYLGESMDSLQWTFTSSTTSSTSSDSIFSLSFLSAGTYNIALTGYLGNLIFSTDSLAAFIVHAPSETTLNSLSCNPSDTGVFIANLQGQFGCDSTIINRISLSSSTAIEVVYNNGNLSTLQTGSSYQWLNCIQNNVPILGAINQSYTPTSNGSYAVVIVNAGCSDTSACLQVTGINILDLLNDNGILVYPNPFDNLVTIDFTEKVQEANIDVYDVTGSLLKQEQLINVKNFVLDFSNFARGTYFIHVLIDGRKELIEVLKK